MKIWAISDPHLGFGSDKMMDIFGKHWDDHPIEMANHWRAQVAEEDVVILSGDISWAIDYKELLPDFKFLDALPGHKYIGRGNHDFWWVSQQKNHRFCEEHGFKNFEFIRSNAFLLPATDTGFTAGGSILCGTRGWITPTHPDWKQTDDKYYRRELIRLQLALEAALKLRQHEEPLLAALHYPPYGPNGEPSEFTEMLEKHGVKLCLFGHVHGYKGRLLQRYERGGIQYLNTASDVLDFKPLNIGAAVADLLQ